MAVLDLFKRLVNADATGGERRAGERVRTTLGARVLVVDDSATIRAVLGKMLVQDGYEVMKAADGEGAIEAAQSQCPDLIFLDIVLPEMSGFAVLRALRRDPRTHATPIVMMSGNQQATEQFYVQRFGADGFIRKPFGRVEVFRAIRALVQEDRMPARVIAPPPPTEIPEGMSAEEWAAIPDIALPDDEPVASGAPPSGGASPTTAAAGSNILRSEAVITGQATSMAMRPTLALDRQLAPGPRVVVQVDLRHAPAAGGNAAIESLAELPIEGGGN